MINYFEWETRQSIPTDVLGDRCKDRRDEASKFGVYEDGRRERSGMSAGSCEADEKLHRSGAPSAALMLQNGFALLKLKLPSQAEHCLFVLQLRSQTVGDLKQDILKEDDSLQSVAFYITEEKVEQRQLPQLHLLLQTLQQYRSAEKIGEQERNITKQLANVQEQLLPLKEQVDSMVNQANRRAKASLWFGLCYLGAQGGILARLTWWEYSWDVMEPITYFVTYAGVLVSYGYFLITRQPYEYPVIKDRIAANYLHRAVTNSRFNVKTVRDAQRTSIHFGKRAFSPKATEGA
uniref:Calcium uniporter protein n=1 Tax=Trichuris muris TaxID=70415 RepID=A0A5S6QVI2_TRIMR